MTAGTSNNGEVSNGRAQRRLLWLGLSAAWLLGLLTFSLPGREGPESLGALDGVALAKTVALLVVIAAGVAALLSCHNPSRRRLVVHALFPLVLFLGWAILSTAWSPLKTVSLGQAGSLAAQLLLAAVIGLAVTSQRDLKRVLFQLNAMLLVVAAILVGVHLVWPESSGLAREMMDEGSVGLMHSTSAGATASLGIILLMLTKLIWDFPWSRWLLAPGLLVHSALLFFANSRTAIAMTGAVLLIALPLLMQRGRLAALVVATSSIGALYLCLDPGLGLVDAGFASTGKYLMRHESTEQLSSLTGRTDLWAAVWPEFCKSPLQGCGYFVTSQNGLLDVWTGPANRTAHNVLLQVLSSTGLIGLAMFLWGIVRVVRRSARDLAGSEDGRRLGTLLLFVGFWYLGWGQLCASFMGPIRPESITFFCCLGLALSGLQASSTQSAVPPLPSSRSVPRGTTS